MKFFAVLYIFPLLYTYLFPDLREPLINYQATCYNYQATCYNYQAIRDQVTREIHRTPRNTTHQTPHRARTPIAIDTQDSTQTTPAPAAPLITRSIPESLPCNGRSRSLSKQCNSPKIEDLWILALQRTNSASSHLQPHFVADQTKKSPPRKKRAMSRIKKSYRNLSQFCLAEKKSPTIHLKTPSSSPSSSRTLPSPLSLKLAATTHFDFVRK